MDVEAISNAWAAQDTLYVVVHTNDRFHIEKPEESATYRKGVQEESLLRVFSSSADVMRYRRHLESACNVTGLQVLRMNLSGVMDPVPFLNRKSLFDSGCTLRVELCSMSDESEYPQEIDTLWSMHTSVN